MKELRQYGVYLAKSVNVRLNAAAKATGKSRGKLFRLLLDTSSSVEALNKETEISRERSVFRTFNVHPDKWSLHADVVHQHRRSMHTYLSALIDVGLKKMGY